MKPTASLAAPVLALSCGLAAPLAAAPHECHGRDDHVHPLARWLEDDSASASFPGLGIAQQEYVAITTPELFAHPCVVGAIEPPTGWISADGHTHHESCDGVLPEPDRLYFGSDCLGEQFMAPRDVEISTSLLWATGVVDLEPFTMPNVYLQGGQCLQVGHTEVVYRNQWEGGLEGGIPVPGVVERLTGKADSFLIDYLAYGVPARDRIVQAGIEVSGWDAGNLGHVGGMNLTAEGGGELFAHWDELATREGCAPLFDGTVGSPLEERFPFQELLQHYDCGAPGPAPALGGHKNDGTGNWSLPIFEIFARDEDSIAGYMHQYWPIDTVVGDDDYGPTAGWDWYAHLGPEYAESEIRCFPTDLRAAFPDNFEGGNLKWPLFAGPDAALGWVDYLEARSLTIRDTSPNTKPVSWECAGGTVVACGDADHHTTPKDAWYGMYYKLLSAGVFTSVSAGSDGTCDEPCVPRTWVRVGDVSGMTPSEVYDAYTAALARGHVSLASESYHFLDLSVDGAAIGERVSLPAPGSVDVVVRYELLPSLLDPQNDPYFFDPAGAHFGDDDRIVELVVSGEVVASTSLHPTDFVDGVATLSFGPVDVSDSAWLAARTRSTTVHTGATAVTVAQQPIANCLEAEYWLLYCDYLQFKIDAYDGCQYQVGSDGGQAFVPEFVEHHLGCSRVEIEEHVAAARRVFRGLRDLASGDPYGVARHGTKHTSTCREPLALYVGGEISYGPGPELRVGTVNAPPDAAGVLLVGSAQWGPVSTFALEPPYFFPDVQVIPAWSNHGGHHEVTTRAGLGTLGAIHVQYIWTDTAPCTPDEIYTWTRAATLTPPPWGVKPQ